MSIKAAGCALRLVLLALLALVSMAAEARPWLLLFGSEGCEQCEEIRELWNEREGEAVLVYVSIDKEANYRFLSQIEQALKIERPGNAFPVVFVGGRLATGLDGFYRLAPELEELLAMKQEHPIFREIQAAADAATEKTVSWNVPEKPSADTPVEGAKRPFSKKKVVITLIFVSGILAIGLFFYAFSRSK